jgi:hypothetical protein
MNIIKEYINNEAHWTITLGDSNKLYKIRFIRNVTQVKENFNKKITGAFYLIDGDKEVLLSSKKEFLFSECSLNEEREVKLKFVDSTGMTSGKEISLIAELKKG